MTTETNRTWGKVPVQLPGGATVNVRVVTEITFEDPVNRGQETTFTIINQLGSGQANRDVHVDTVEAQDGTGSLDVERIDTYKVLDPVDRAQETFQSVDNVTGSTTDPPSFTTHIKTHTTKFFSDDQVAFIETEWIDEFVVLDPVDRAQETHYYVTGNPPDDVSSQAQADDPDVSGSPENGEGDGGLPVRTDWFQNIVDLSATLPFCNVRIQCTAFSGTITGSFDSGVLLDDPPPDGTGSTPPGTILDGSYVSSFSNTITSSISSSGFITTVGPAVSCSKTSFSYSDWTLCNGQGSNIGGTIAANQMRKSSPGLGTTPSIPPLVINGKTIPGFTSALSFDAHVSASQFVGSVQSYSSLAREPPFSDWWNFTGAPVEFDFPSSPTGDTYTVTVSPEPFLFGGVMWKAVGIGAGVVLNVPAYGFPFPGASGAPFDVAVYVIRA